MKTIFFLMIVGVVILSACAPSPQAVGQALSSTLNAMPTQTAYPTYTPNPTLTPYSTYTPYPTYTPAPTYTPKIIVVTATSSPTALYTSTATLDPTQAAWITMTAEKEPGFYLVGVDIAPGHWRSTGKGSGCYWASLDEKGEIIDNNYGLAGVTAYIPQNAYQVEFGEKCGTWVYLGD